jgi:peptidoglycan/xylan/chitin deacetylase (PgdA/CDA1 family)
MVAVGFLVIALLAAVSSASIPQKRQLARIISSCTTRKTVALTFDDGPYIYNEKVVDTLDAAGAIGTFFFNGNNYECIYSEASVARVLYTVQHGHQVESHTWRHKDLASLSFDQIHNEMWLVEQALQKIAGVYPAFMRPPYRSYNDLVLQVTAERNQTLVLWDVDPGDSTGSTPTQSKDAYDAVIGQHLDTMLTINHETYETTADEVLPYAIQQLQAAGYRLVSLSECTGLPAYQSVQAPGVRDSSWTC